MRSLLLEFLRFNNLTTGMWREGDPYLVATGTEYPVRQFTSPLEHEAFLDLVLALPRPQVLKRLWAQLAALGVRHIALTNAARVERDYFDTHVLSPATYGLLLLEGLEQAQDTWVPGVSIHKRLRVLVEDELSTLVAPGSDSGPHRPVLPQPSSP